MLPVTPAGEKPVRRTIGGDWGSIRPCADWSIFDSSSFVRRAVSTFGLAVKGMVTLASLCGSSFSSSVVFSTEFGIIIRLPSRSRTTVCRHVTSCTSPVMPDMRTMSPGCSTCENMSWNPPIVLAIESLRPSETANPPMPSAVNSVIGLTPNTGLSTIVTAMTQISTRARLTKIEASGICDFSSALRNARETRRAVTYAATQTMTRKMMRGEWALSQSMACCIPMCSIPFLMCVRAPRDAAAPS